MKNVEVEFKHTLTDPEKLAARLAELGADSLGRARQTDTYFNAPHKDFLAHDVVSEWLRLRVEPSGASVNFKRWLPVGVVESTHCDEFESLIDDADAVRKILESLDFTEMVVVDKTRTQWRLEDVVVALDEVDGLGSFVEFEYSGDAEIVEVATEHLHAVIAKIGVELGERDRRGYPYLLLGRER
jgi:adenylate cyclase, class 2